MSKYIKLEDAISKIVNTPTRIITDDLTALVNRQHEIIDMLSELPTIEVSEDDLYIPLNNQTVERINRLHKNECGDYFDEEWLFNELEQISEFREVSEDCISREYILGEAFMSDEYNRETKSFDLPVVSVRDIEDAPSVVPKRSCYRCGLREDCEGSTERKPKEGEWIRVSADKYVQHAYHHYRCSACGEDTIGEPNYCPNCGARMRREK